MILNSIILPNFFGKYSKNKTEKLPSEKGLTFVLALASSFWIMAFRKKISHFASKCEIFL